MAVGPASDSRILPNPFTRWGIEVQTTIVVPVQETDLLRFGATGCGPYDDPGRLSPPTTAYVE